MIAPVANHFRAYSLFILVTVAIWQIINVFITTPYFMYSVYFAPGGVRVRIFLSDHYRGALALPQVSRAVLDIASAVIYSYFFVDGRYDLVPGWLAILMAFDFLNVQLVTPEII
jgi:hypothetical protein